MNITKDITYNNELCQGFRYNLLLENDTVVFLNIMINYEENVSVITDFFCIKKDEGYGSLLLNYVIEEIKRLKVKAMLLDDMTTRYRASHNIYRKFGFKYLYDYGPEMELLLD